MPRHLREPDLRRRAGRAGLVLPGQVALLLEPPVREEQVPGRAEPVVGRHHHGDVLAGQPGDLGDRRVEAAEVALAELDHLALPVRRRGGPERRVDEPPAEVLELVDAIEHDRHQVRVGVLAQEVAQHLQPALLAARVQLDPLGVLVLGAALDRLRLELHVERELARVEARQLLEAVEQAGRVAAQAQLAPRHPAAGHDRARDGRRREHHREVERDHALAVVARQRPDRGRLDVLRGGEAVVLAVGRLALEEVEHAVLARPLAGHQRSPGRRGQRRHDRAQRGPRPPRREVAQERHDAALHVRVEHGEGGAVEPDEQRARHRHASSTATGRCAAMNDTSAATLTSRSATGRSPISASHSANGNRP